jgi:hypothetical protein
MNITIYGWSTSRAGHNDGDRFLEAIPAGGTTQLVDWRSQWITRPGHVSGC